MLNFFKRTDGLRDGDVDHEQLLDQVVYEVPGTGTPITWRDTVEGTLITGSTGSGKSSGPGRHIALSMLRSGFGMVVLCAKSDERKRWERLAAETGRTGDLVVFGKHSGLTFNFLEYEMSRGGEGAGDVLNINNILMNLAEQGQNFQAGGGGKGDEKFWQNSERRLNMNVISTLKMTGEEVSVKNMRKLVSGSFKGDEYDLYNRMKYIAIAENSDPKIRKQAIQDLESWSKTNYFFGVFAGLDEIVNRSDNEQAHELRDFWKEFARLHEETRSIITESFMGTLQPFFGEGILKKLFASGLSEELLPENVIKKNKIVVLDFPLKEFGLSGAYASTIYKATFQAAMERRDIEAESNPKPVGLWIDEYQSFCNPMTDSLFQATARSSWVACVYITQSINNLFFVMGQNMPEARAKSLLGNLNLKYFASNSDFDTNIWASNMIGQHYVTVDNVSFSHDMEVSKTKNQQLEYRVTPDHFTILKTGGSTNKFAVESVVFKAGNRWGKDGRNFAIVTFNQKR